MTHITGNSIPELDLDDLLEESKAAASDAFSLDDLLAESVASAGEKIQAKLARAKLAAGNLSEKEKAETEALIRQWELKREWDRKANVLVFSRQRCTGCGNFHTNLIGTMERHTGVHNKTLVRWVQVKKFECTDLPKEVKYEDSDVSICHSCADFHDFPLEED